MKAWLLGAVWLVSSVSFANQESEISKKFDQLTWNKEGFFQGTNALGPCEVIIHRWLSPSGSGSEGVDIQVKDVDGAVKATVFFGDVPAHKIVQDKKSLAILDQGEGFSLTQGKNRLAILTNQDERSAICEISK